MWRHLLACQWQRRSGEEAFVGLCAEVGDDLGSALVDMTCFEIGCRPEYSVRSWRLWRSKILYACYGGCGSAGRNTASGC
ncbi:hypothetical protein ACQP1K_17480 [Sphaerimonospora sp. CA-214678]|uniref:hypothetical protein n=1 Tax=Sphaerimonospora sp. CA-214678 TaxID=3240029 RepID=UPI003D917859